MNRTMSRKSGTVRRIGPHRFTEEQGQYLAFIYVYRMFRQAPAEADMQRHFRVSPPSVHQMVLGLERDGLIRRQPGVAGSIDLLVPPQDLPILDWLNVNSSKSNAARKVAECALVANLSSRIREYTYEFPPFVYSRVALRRVRGARVGLVE